MSVGEPVNRFQPTIPPTTACEVETGSFRPVIHVYSKCHGKCNGKATGKFIHSTELIQRARRPRTAEHRTQSDKNPRDGCGNPEFDSYETQLQVPNTLTA